MSIRSLTRTLTAARSRFTWAAISTIDSARYWHRRSISRYSRFRPAVSASERAAMTRVRMSRLCRSLPARPRVTANGRTRGPGSSSPGDVPPRDGHRRGQDGERGCPGRGHRSERTRGAGVGPCRAGCGRRSRASVRCGPRCAAGMAAARRADGDLVRAVARLPAGRRVACRARYMRCPSEVNLRPRQAHAARLSIALRAVGPDHAY